MNNKSMINAVLCGISAVLSFILAFRYKKWIYVPIGICQTVMAMLHFEDSRPQMIDVDIDD